MKALVPALFVLLVAAQALGGEPAPELTETAYKIATKQMDAIEWESYVMAAKKKYDEWAKEHDGDMGNFLNEKFLEIAPAARGGKIEHLKKLVYWMALYKYFEEPTPHYLKDVSDKHKQQVADIVSNFSWEKLSDMVKGASKEYVGGEEQKK